MISLKEYLQESIQYQTTSKKNAVGGDNFKISATVDGTEIGYVKFSNNQKDIWILGLYVQPEYRNKKLGQQLVNMVKNYKLPIYVRTYAYKDEPLNDDQLIEFYNKLGFTSIEGKPKYYLKYVSVNENFADFVKRKEESFWLMANGNFIPVHTWMHGDYVRDHFKAFGLTKKDLIQGSGDIAYAAIKKGAIRVSIVHKYSPDNQSIIQSKAAIGCLESSLRQQADKLYQVFKSRNITYIRVDIVGASEIADYISLEDFATKYMR